MKSVPTLLTGSPSSQRVLSEEEIDENFKSLFRQLAGEVRGQWGGGRGYEQDVRGLDARWSGEDTGLGWNEVGNGGHMGSGWIHPPPRTWRSASRSCGPSLTGSSANVSLPGSPGCPLPRSPPMACSRLGILPWSVWLGGPSFGPAEPPAPFLPSLPSP